MSKEYEIWYRYFLYPTNKCQNYKRKYEKKSYLICNVASRYYCFQK